jgi:hypothetical protein
VNGAPADTVWAPSPGGLTVAGTGDAAPGAPSDRLAGPTTTGPTPGRAAGDDAAADRSRRSAPVTAPVASRHEASPPAASPPLAARASEVPPKAPKIVSAPENPEGTVPPSPLANRGPRDTSADSRAPETSRAAAPGDRAGTRTLARRLGDGVREIGSALVEGLRLVGHGAKEILTEAGSPLEPPGPATAPLPGPPTTPGVSEGR